MAERRGWSGWLRGALRNLLADLPHLLLVFVALPVTVLLFMIPSSWYRADGYADLGEVDFVASEVDQRTRRYRADERGIVYRATDGSGLSFRETGPRHLARAAVEAQQHVRRRVYIARQKPNAILRLFRFTAGRLFLPPGENLQDHLNAARRIAAAGRAGGLGYMALYTAAGLRRRRGRRGRL